MEENKEKCVEVLETLKKNDTLYLLLASLISSDNIVDEESAQNRLHMVEEVEKAVPKTDFTDEMKENVMSYITKAKDILNKDISRFRAKKAEN